MTAHSLYLWKSCMSAEDYTYLVQFVEQANLGQPNDRIVVLCGLGTGKLLEHIRQFIGIDHVCNTKFPITQNDGIKLYVVGEEFPLPATVISGSIIMTSTRIELFNGLEEHIRIINMIR